MAAKPRRKHINPSTLVAPLMVLMFLLVPTMASQEYGTPTGINPFTNDALIDNLLKRRFLEDRAVEEAFRAVDRKYFVAPDYREEPRYVYGDGSLPMAGGATLEQPSTTARIFDELVKFMNDRHQDMKGKKALVVGSGSGLSSTYLALLTKASVTGVDHIPQLVSEATGNVERFKKDSANELLDVTFHVGDGRGGFVEKAPYDVILVEAGVADDAPGVLKEQLAPGGVMMVPIDNSRRAGRVTHHQVFSQTLHVVTKALNADGGAIDVIPLKGKQVRLPALLDKDIQDTTPEPEEEEEQDSPTDGDM